jgi:hypothetical protein
MRKYPRTLTAHWVSTTRRAVAVVQRSGGATAALFTSTCTHLWARCARTAYVGMRHIRRHTSAYVSIRQQTSADVSIRQHTSADVSRRQQTSADVSIRCVRRFVDEHKHAPKALAQAIRECFHACAFTSAYVSIRQHTSAYVSIRQHPKCWRRRFASASTLAPSDTSTSSANTLSLRESPRTPAAA